MTQNIPSLIAAISRDDRFFIVYSLLPVIL